MAQPAEMLMIAFEGGLPQSFLRSPGVRAPGPSTGERPAK
jgi:hypothetical protein